MKNNLLPEVWGPSGWRFMHYVALGYPDEPTEHDRMSYKRFYESLVDVLPCQGCANHYKENIANVPIDDHLKDRESLLRWTFDIHNEVNKLKGKPILSYEDALKLYTQKQFPALDVLCKVLVLLAILVFLYFLILHKQ
mgnify:FL=1|tara:strand:+ start:257 stop:670 length:414 start_codon:yes stop_codon:yes gene_type:complete